MSAAKRRWGQVAVIILALLVLSGTALAKMEWSIKPVRDFVVPAGNLIDGGDMSGGIPASFRLGYDWAQNNVFDTSTYLTGKGSIRVFENSGGRGRLYVDVPVDSDKVYKLGFVVKTKDIQLLANNQSMQWGVFFKDGLGAWVDNREPVKTLPPDYLNGLQAAGIVTRTPNEVDLGDGPKPISGTHDWFLVELTLDLPALAVDLQAGLGRITLLRVEQVITGPAGTMWIDCVYLVPVE